MEQSLSLSGPSFKYASQVSLCISSRRSIIAIGYHQTRNPHLTVFPFFFSFYFIQSLPPLNLISWLIGNNLTRKKNKKVIANFNNPLISKQSIKMLTSSTYYFKSLSYLTAHTNYNLSVKK